MEQTTSAKVVISLNKDDIIRIARKEAVIPIPEDWIGIVTDDSHYDDDWSNIIVEFSPPSAPRYTDEGFADFQNRGIKYPLKI